MEIETPVYGTVMQNIRHTAYNILITEPFGEAADSGSEKMGILPIPVIFSPE
ncbi:Uncharacterized protein dnm_020680 [Desulfonema magnum]|uniref:Uncharacterized protein n=1 Tax=Desulfonema magnum TaxID=45655 RepID=A0A975BJ64_9BACT|nr:Uncharacterized protein dnm_020680 [Desulfonema magnum]